MSEAPTGPGAEEEVQALERAVADLEGRRDVLGDTVVDVALAPLRQRLAEARGGSEQRRLVTVVFADLVDFTVLSSRFDAEDVRSIVDRYFARWSVAVRAHGGSVEKFIGDAVMAVFGLEHSYEDDARRAVRASLAVLETLGPLNDELDAELGVRLEARVGVDTGEVVVSTLGDRDGAAFVAVGSTVNRASRLQTAAPVGGVLVSDDTARLLRGAFAMDAVPGLVLKGIDGPVDAWTVRRELGGGFRQDRAPAVEGVVAATVGREWWLQQLQERLEEVADDASPRVVTVVGEAGIGKTRLLLDLDAWLVARPERVWGFRGRAAPTTSGFAGALLRDVLAARLDIRLDEDRIGVLARFADAFSAALGPDDGPPAAAAVAAWLGFAEPAAAADPQGLRDRGSEALAAYLAALAAREPVVVLLEDLHWADDETLRWLDDAARLLDGSPVLVVASARPELFAARPHWGEGLAHHVRLDLPPLTRRQSRELVGRLLVHLPKPPKALVDLLLDAGEGNPFYLEELVGWLVDVGIVVPAEPVWRLDEARIGAVAVPATLRGVLQSRLDALGGRERGLLQRAAVVGRVFWDAAVDSLDAAAGTAGPALDTLRERDVVLQREVSRFTDAREFVFKHALLRDVAYDAVLRRHRERYHRAAAEWLIATSGRAGRAEEHAAVIADHLERGADPRAARWHLRAAEQAAAVYALAEAALLLDRAERTAEDDATRFDVALAREALLDRTGDRTAQEAVLGVLDGLAPAVDDERRVLLHLVRSRWAFVHSDNAGTIDAALEAERIALRLGREDLVAEALAMQGKARTWNDEIDAADDLLRRAAALAERAGRPAVVAETLRYRSMLAGNVGDFPAAVTHGEAASAMFAALGDAEMEAMALAQTATTYYRVGRFADAQAALEQSLAIFRRAGHRYREVMAMANLASVALQRGELAVARRYAAEAHDAQRELGDLDSVAVTLIVLGGAEMLSGRADAAQRRFDEALATARAVSSTTLVADALVRLSNAALLRGDVDTALARAAEAVETGADAVSGLERASASLALGAASLAAGRTEPAEEAFRAAAAEADALGVAVIGREAAVGLAAALAARGATAAAVAALEPVLPHLGPDDLAGALLPGEVLGHAVAVLDAAGDPRAAAVRERARDHLRTVAARAGDQDAAAGFLALPTHAALLADPVG